MLHHIELYVSDLERSAAFWSEFMALLDYRTERWSGGMTFVRGPREAYVCLLPSPDPHRSAGYHRKRVGLNHLAFSATSRAHVDVITAWVRRSGHTILYEDRHPYAGGRGHYAVFFEDPDRIKLEVVAPGED
jgi:catechol 2,3-dioxygenase-like lactoylglutathione lyase family enzyme